MYRTRKLMAEEAVRLLFSSSSSSFVLGFLLCWFEDEGRRTRTRDEGRGTKDEDEGRRTRDEGRGTKDEDEGRRTRTRTKDEGRGRGTKDEDEDERNKSLRHCPKGIRIPSCNSIMRNSMSIGPNWNSSLG